MEVLSIDENKKPYFTYLVFFVTLAAIKRNNFEATKVLSLQFLFGILVEFPDSCNVKFIYSEKVTKFCEISTLDLTYVVTVNSIRFRISLWPSQSI